MTSSIGISDNMDSRNEQQPQEKEVTDGQVKLDMDKDEFKAQIVNEPPVRHDLIASAVNFLLNPQIKNNPVEKKRSFLIKKGLTTSELEIAFDFADRGMIYELPVTYQPSPVTNYVPQHVMTYSNHAMTHNMSPYMSQNMVWDMTRSMISSIALISGFVTAIYFLYKNYIEPWLFGPPKETKHPLIVITENVNKLQNAVESLKSDLSHFEQSIKNTVESSIGRIVAEVNLRSPATSGATSGDISQLKKEVLSLKALFLNQSQFPESPIVSMASSLNVNQPSVTGFIASTNGSSSPPNEARIPSWQLEDGDQNGDNEEKERQ